MAQTSSLHPPPAYVETVMATHGGAGKQQQQPQVTAPQYTVYQIPPQSYAVNSQVVQLLPKEVQPNDYLVLSVVIAIFCGILNVTSLMFSIPAVVFSGMAYERRSNGGYTSARKLANAAVILNVVCVFWVMFCGIITVSFVSACVYEAGICDYYYDK